MAEHESSLTRRGFLTTAGAAAAVGAGVVATGGVAGAQAGTGQGGGNGNGGGNGGGAGDEENEGEVQRGGEGAVADDAAVGAAPTYPSIADSPETWIQPWVFSPNGDPDHILNLRVVEYQNNLLFSYNGATPGPTVRMGGTDTLRVRLENGLGLDEGLSTVGPNPSSGSIPGPEGAMIKALAGSADPAKAYGGTPQNPNLNQIPTEPVPDWCLGEHVNGVHTAHVTNMHTHGLHVSPGRNDDGTHSDNIYLRIVPQADYDRMAQDPDDCLGKFQEALELKDGEIVPARADYEFRLGNTPATPVHPPGTHWYHPHSHGSTHTQVSSGMAGFLIVEGDVDEALNEQLAGTPIADPDVRTGPWNYRERTMFAQRVIFNAVTSDPDEKRVNIAPKAGSRFRNLVNGQPEPNVIVMAPNAIERWRILNGSVDGSGYLRVMVLKGRFESEGAGSQSKLYRVVDGSEPQLAEEQEWAGTMSFGRSTVVPLSDLKQNLHQLAWDGVTLVRGTGNNNAEYFIKDLSQVNGGQEPDFKDKRDCYQGDNLLLCYNRPNELALTPANRSDVLFQAPPLSASGAAEQYTVIGLPTQFHDSKGTPTSGFQILAHIVVRGEPVDGPAGVDFGVLDLPLVPDYLKPVTDDDLRITPAEFATRPELDGSTYRTRTVSYAGWGTNGFPRFEVPESEVVANPGLDKLQYYVAPAPNTPGLQVPGKGGPTDVSDLQAFGADELPTLALPPNTRTMSIDGHKFEPSNTDSPTMWVNTAEEWAVYNESIECWAIETKPKSGVSEAFAQDNVTEASWFTYMDADGNTSAPQLWGTAVSYPLRFNEIVGVNEEGERGQPGKPAQIVKPQTGSADHPFHIHQNPFWLIRLEVPNADGDLINVLPEPRWADVTFLPRNGGRAIFRSRFDDYTGEFVNHCHILLHEDNGMMQRVQIVDGPGSGQLSNYDGSETVASPSASAASTNAVYPPPTPDEMWLACATFTENNNSGQLYPLENGWQPSPPDPLSHL